jgi:choline dehydrogenase-like flavoprotein
MLASAGLDVVLLEAGPQSCVDVSSLGFDPSFDAASYPGAVTGRYFGIGGSTSRWGGQLVPHTELDLRPGDRWLGAWEHVVAVVQAYAKVVVQRLGFADNPDFEGAASRSLGPIAKVVRASGLTVQTGLMLPFRAKNLAWLLSREIAGKGSLRVYFNAVANNWGIVAAMGAKARISKVEAVSPKGQCLTVLAKQFVIAAGAIESARILLEINCRQQTALRLSSEVGCYLSDHLSMAIADVESADRSVTGRLFRPRFSGPWMRGFRFLESAPTAIAPRGFAHFIFAELGKGFAVAKDILTALQAGRRPTVNAIGLARGGVDLVRLAFHRYATASLYVPRDTPVHLQLDVEQMPVRANCVRLGTEADRYGRPTAAIRWEVSSTDIENIRTIANRFISSWPSNVGGFPALKGRALDSDASIKPNDAYHPVGTCRLGDDKEAVVDCDLRVYGTQNLWVAGTGTLPSAGTANPTLSALCMTHRLADHLRTSSCFN